jgi:hypothetical protein
MSRPSLSLLGVLEAGTSAKLPPKVAIPLPTLDNAIAVRDVVGWSIADVYAGSRVREKSDLLGIEAAEPGRFSQPLIGGQKDTSVGLVFAPTQGRC